jgi:hypothetical protein
MAQNSTCSWVNAQPLSNEVTQVLTLISALFMPNAVPHAGVVQEAGMVVKAPVRLAIF